jgi:hypothetical protein
MGNSSEIFSPKKQQNILENFIFPQIAIFSQFLLTFQKIQKVSKEREIKPEKAEIFCKSAKRKFELRID